MMNQLEVLEFSWDDVLKTANQYLPQAKEALQQYAPKVAAVVGIGQDILGDPALPEVIALTKKIVALETAGKKPSTKPTVKTPGIGLSRVVGPMKGYIFYKQNPWILPVGIGFVLLMPALIGYKVGKRSCR
jgi:hypothetical protein